MARALAKGEKKFPPNQNPLDALVAARKMIEQPENWCQHEWGENGKHCMGGAISRSSSMLFGVFDEAVGFLRHHTDGLSLDKFNDSHTHTDVLAAYDAAIANASEKYTLTPFPAAMADPPPAPTSTAEG